MALAQRHRSAIHFLRTIEGNLMKSPYDRPPSSSYASYVPLSAEFMQDASNVTLRRIASSKQAHISVTFVHDSTHPVGVPSHAQSGPRLLFSLRIPCPLYLSLVQCPPDRLARHRPSGSPVTFSVNSGGARWSHGLGYI